MTEPGDVLDALSDPTRRHVLERLRGGPLAVVDLAAHLPVSRPAVSQHLKVLKDAGLVEVDVDGRLHRYAIARSGFEPLRAWVESFWDLPLTRFKHHAEATAPPTRRRARARDHR